MTDGSARRTRPRRRGRPPAGEGGARVKDYPQLSVRLPRDIREKLVILSRLRRLPQWRLVVDSLECYLRDLPDAERRRVASLARRGAASRSRA
jgi:hypothetical protein